MITSDLATAFAWNVTDFGREPPLLGLIGWDKFPVEWDIGLVSFFGCLPRDRFLPIIFLRGDSSVLEGLRSL